MGRLVANLVNEVKNAGNHQLVYVASETGSGIYYYQLQAGDHIVTNKMMVLE